MKVEVKKLDATRRELKFLIPKERVSKKLDEIYSEIGKVAKIKGFRPGKAPRHLVEAQHGKLAREETIKKLIPEAYTEALENEKITPMDLPDIQDVAFKDGMISFTALLDIKPDVKIKEYKNIKITRKNAQVTDEDLAKTLEFFKKGQGDKEVVLDDTFARGIGYPTFEDFKSSLKRQLEMERDRQNRINVENQIVEYLLKEASISVPQSAIDRQLEHRLEDSIKRLKSQGIKESDLQKRAEELGKELRPAAEKDVKTFLILEYIAKQENITVAEGENLFYKVMEFLLREAKWEETK